MKSISAELDTHLQRQVTTVATCWEITRKDGQVFRFTDHNADLSIDGNTYYADIGYTRSSIVNDATMGVDNLEVKGIVDSTILKEDELRAGLFDHAEIKIFLVNYKDLTQGIMRLRRGWIGEVIYSSGGTFQTELRGMTQALSQRIGELYSAECRAHLGDTRCQVPINPDILGRSQSVVEGEYYRVPAIYVSTDPDDYEQSDFQNRIFRVVSGGTTGSTQPVYNFTVASTTTDGTAELEAVEAWMRHAVVASVTDRRTFTLTVTESRAVDDWFNLGALIFEDGDNAGVAIEIKDWVQTSNTVTLFLTAPFIVEVGTKVKLYPGCDKRLDTCRNRYANVLNFRGEPFVPGQDEAHRYPDAK